MHKYFLNPPSPLIKSSLQPKRVLVAGGAGFLGSHLCDALLTRGEEVICLDNLYTGQATNISHLFSHPSFTFIEHNICEPFSWPLPLHEIYNLACPASPCHYQKDSIYTLKTNVLGALNLLELARQHQASIFQASTSEVYGDPLHHPQTETDWGNVNPIGLRACYDEGKRCVETLFFCYQRQYGLSIKVARIFNTYGPRMCLNDKRVISNFIKQALTNQPITIYGKGQQTRSFCYISDLITAILRFMATPAEITGPFNLGNDEELTILELAQTIQALTNSTSPLVFKALPQDDPHVRRPDLTLAKTYLQWQPEVSLTEGLKKIIEDFQTTLNKQFSLKVNE